MDKKTKIKYLKVLKFQAFCDTILLDLKERREQMSLEEAIRKIQILESENENLKEEAIRKIQILELENENIKLENKSLKRIIFG